MTIEEKNNELAFFDDWQLHWQNKGGGELFNVKPSGHCWSVWTPPLKWWNTPIGQAAILSGDFDPRPPNYFKDLNAVHELFKCVPQNLKPKYFTILCSQVSSLITLNGYYEATEATAEQRCEAIGKTLDLW